MKNLIKTNVKKGFSLVELLVVIAVIGVIAAIAIPAMSGIFGKSDAAKDRRNAQSIVSTFNSARAAGNVVSFPAGPVALPVDLGAVITTGLSGAGAFDGSIFVAPMDEDEAQGAIDAGPITLVGDSDTTTVMQLTATSTPATP